MFDKVQDIVALKLPVMQPDVICGLSFLMILDFRTDRFIRQTV